MKLTPPNKPVEAAMQALQSEYRQAKSNCDLAAALQDSPEWHHLSPQEQHDMLCAKATFAGYLMGVAKGIAAIRDYTGVIGGVL